MRIVIAIDSFKGSMSSLEAGNAARDGLLRAAPEDRIMVRPLADGGEGTVEALVSGLGGIQRRSTVTGPLGDPVETSYGIISVAPHPACQTDAGGNRQYANSPCPERSDKTAVIEIAAAAGITRIPEDRRNPMTATTYGVGELIRDAIGQGCRHFIVGIGGSGTNDGGIGMLQALGYGLLDASGRPVPPGAAGLRELQTIADGKVLPELADCDFRIACDVSNPLCGPEGASAVYGPQKGADPAMIQDMDRWMKHYAELVMEYNKKADPSAGGTGAAGGLGFAFASFLHSVMEPGVRIVLEETHLEEYIRDADLVITGEGRLDGQSVMGKAPVGVASLAKKYGKPVIAFAGSVTPDAVKCNECGIDAFFPVLRRIQTLPEAMRPEIAKRNLADTAEQVRRLLDIRVFR